MTGHSRDEGKWVPLKVIAWPALCGLMVAVVVTSACDLVSSPEDSSAIQELRAVFGEDLDHEDALKFASLTSELKAALTAQAEAVGYESALGYLREMPEEVQPIGRLVTPEDMELFRELDSRRQRIVLLEGYAHGWARWRHDSPPSGDARFSRLSPMILAAHTYLFPDGYKVPLVPYHDILSSSEKAKLASMDSLMSSIYSRRWDSRRVSPSLVERLERQLRRELANAPTTTSGILESGHLEAKWGFLWEEVPETLDFTRQYVAEKLIIDGHVGPDEIAALDRELMRLRDSKARDLFASGFISGHHEEFPVPLVCEWDASTGVWFEWAVPSAFGNLDPQDLVLTMPSPMMVLSGAARDRLESLGSELQRGFGRSWYTSSGTAQAMACMTMKRDRYLTLIPLTELPEMSTLLNSQSLSLFEELPDDRQQDVIDFAVKFIVEGEIRIGGVYGQPLQEVEAYGMSPEEFLRELRTTTEIAVNVVTNWGS